MSVLVSRARSLVLKTGKRPTLRRSTPASSNASSPASSRPSPVSFRSSVASFSSFASVSGGSAATTGAATTGAAGTGAAGMAWLGAAAVKGSGTWHGGQAGGNVSGFFSFGAGGTRSRIGRVTWNFEKLVILMFQDKNSRSVRFDAS